MQNQFELIVPKSVGKSLVAIPLPWRERMMKAIDLLPQSPFIGEKLRGKLEGKRKIRVYPYRAIYRIDEKNKQIIVVEAGHRQGIY
jgi:addiction module RelE/StbE family toxin